jgi:transposase
MKRPKVKRMEFDMSELEAIVEQARSTPLSAANHDKLKAVLSTLARLTQELENKRTSISRLRHLLFGARSEKNAAVLKQHGHGGSSAGAGKRNKEKRKGHGRNGASAYRGADRVEVPHESLSSGNPCPHSGCTGKVYDRSDPGVIVRIKGMPPLGGTVYELKKLRCSLCGTVFTARAPAEVGEKKYDETAASMVANLKYGAGFPFHRLEKLQGNLGIPLPAPTQWEIVEDAAHKCEPAFDALIDDAAQGEVLHNDDTPMKILDLLAQNHEPGQDGDGPKRTGLYTTGIISKCGTRLIALFFTGRDHAGENLEQVLTRRAKQRDAPIQMCDALSRNLPGEFKTILGNCLAHGRRRFVDVVDNFPESCRYILETLGEVYANDAVARREQLSPGERLDFHQTQSAPLMQELHEWFERQFSQKNVEPNSGLGQAISYMLNHWKQLTLFLREPGAPLDNNICERALKKAILHRKNSLFYKTQNGARVGDIFMSLIHTAELCGADPFDYLCALQRNTEPLAENPGQWLPWNYRQTLAHITEGLAGDAKPQAP